MSQATKVRNMYAVIDGARSLDEMLTLQYFRIHELNGDRKRLVDDPEPQQALIFRKIAEGDQIETGLTLRHCANDTPIDCFPCLRSFVRL